jgi:hypothetical protein
VNYPKGRRARGEKELRETLFTITMQIYIFF